MSNAPEILDSGSPYWLRLYGKWIHLQGIMPVREVEPQRQFSGMQTVDGYAYEQRAPRGPRSWTLEYRYGTGAATRALESAAYDIAWNTAASGHTLLLDSNLAKVNMVDPDLQERWSKDFSLLGITAPYTVLNVGTATEPFWLPTYEPGVQGTSPNQFTHRLYIPVRAGVTYTAAVWHKQGITGQRILTARMNGVDLAVYAPVSGTRPDDNPYKGSITFTPATDGEVEIILGLSYVSAGLMVYEGDCPPDYYRAGRRMPCEVSVHDAPITNNLIWRYCDPCKLPREHATFTVNEVAPSVLMAAGS